MTVEWRREKGFLVADGREVECWSKVRNECNGLRPRVPLWTGKTDVYYATGGAPAMPREFPKGHWHITGFKEHPDPTEDHGYLYPIFIRTDAVSKVPEWSLDARGRYAEPTGRWLDDRDLGLHFSSCDWTQGCVRIAKEEDARWLWQVLSVEDEFIVT